MLKSKNESKKSFKRQLQRQDRIYLKKTNFLKNESKANTTPRKL